MTNLPLRAFVTNGWLHGCANYCIDSGAFGSTDDGGTAAVGMDRSASSASQCSPEPCSGPRPGTATLQPRLAGPAPARAGGEDTAVGQLDDYPPRFRIVARRRGARLAQQASAGDDGSLIGDQCILKPVHDRDWATP
jgi:hypothetical protein